MNISKEQIDELNAVVTIKVGPEDYTEKYEKAVKKVQQNIEYHNHTNNRGLVALLVARV